MSGFGFPTNSYWFFFICSTFWWPKKDQKSLVSPRVRNYGTWDDRGPTAGPGLGPLFGGALEVGRLRTGAGPTSAPKWWDFSRSTFVPSMFFWVSLCQLSLSLSLSLSLYSNVYNVYNIYIYSIITFFCFNCFGPGNLSWMLCWQLILLEFQELSLMLGPGSFWPQEFQKCVKESLGRKGYSPLRCLQEIWIAPDILPYPSRLYNNIISS